jgi:hypothetical protein
LEDRVNFSPAIAVHLWEVLLPNIVGERENWKIGVRGQIKTKVGKVKGVKGTGQSSSPASCVASFGSSGSRFAVYHSNVLLSVSSSPRHVLSRRAVQDSPYRSHLAMQPGLSQSQFPAHGGHGNSHDFGCLFHAQSAKIAQFNYLALPFIEGRKGC